MTDDLTPSGERAVRLAREVAALRAKVARVEALADEWERIGGDNPGAIGIVARLRTALEGPS